MAQDAPTAWTLGQAVTYALQHNPELLAMREEVRLAQADVRLAAANRRITASVNGYLAAGTTDNMARSAPGSMPEDMQMQAPGRRGDLGVTVTSPLATGGRLPALTRQAESLLAASDADVQAAELRLAYQVHVAYRTVLWRAKLVGVYERDVQARQELARVDEVKLEAGKIPLYYLLRDKTRLADATQMLANARRDREVAMYDLGVLLGLDTPQDLQLTEPPGYAPVELDPARALQDAAARRPELAAVRARTAAAAAGISAAQAEYRPQLSAALMLDLMHDDMGGSGGYTAAVVASMPLTDGGRRAAQMAAAKAQEAQATQRERQTAQLISREVLTALANLRAADQSVKSAMEAVAQAEEDYSVARLRYDAGKAINLEPLDALAALLRARVNLAQGLYDYASATDDLARATGVVNALKDDPKPNSAGGSK